MQELYRQMALKMGRDVKEKSRDNLQKDAEQRHVQAGAKRPGTGRRGEEKVK